MVSRLMKRNARSIRLIATASPKRQKEIIKRAPKSLVDAFGEGALNIAKGRVSLSDKRYGALKRYKCQLHRLANHRSSLKSRKAALQRGGFLPLLASILIPTVASLIAGGR